MPIERSIVMGISKIDIVLMNYILPMLLTFVGFAAMAVFRRVNKKWQKKKVSSRQS